MSANIYTVAILKKQIPFSRQWTPQLHHLNPLYRKIWRPRCTLYFICVSSESLTGGPGCSRGGPHGAPLHPIHKLIPAACGPLFKKGQTCLRPVLHLTKNSTSNPLVHHVTCHRSKAWVAVTSYGGQLSSVVEIPH